MQIFEQKFIIFFIYITSFSSMPHHHYKVKNYKFLMILTTLILLITIPPIALFFALLMPLLNLKKKLNNKGKTRWAFFHPFCNDGGGGEKVLWCMIKELSEKTNHQIAIYSLQADKKAVVQKVQARFNIPLNTDRFQLIHVQGKSLLSSKGFLTMVLHIILPMIYALKCLWKYQPDIFYDTTGYASTLVLVKFLLPTTTTMAYVHYPFISEEMIQKVRQQRADFNNSQAISKSAFLSKAKLFYYVFVLKVYKLIGKVVNLAQTNSSWTHNHMSGLWPTLQKEGRLIKLYPPCTVNKLLSLKKPNADRQVNIVSLAQFRPEKQQHLQLQILAQLLKSGLKRKVVLKICGTTRGPQDQAILSKLQSLASQYNLKDNVEFVVNQPYSKIQECLKDSWFGLHTMQAEHFGISVVEMLAAGLIVVAHNSAGPRFDIIKDQKFLATSKDDYIAKLRELLNKSTEDLNIISNDNRKKALLFGQEQFQKSFMESIESVNKQA